MPPPYQQRPIYAPQQPAAAPTYNRGQGQQALGHYGGGTTVIVRDREGGGGGYAGGGGSGVDNFASGLMVGAVAGAKDKQ